VRIRSEEHGIYLNASTLESEIAATPALLDPLFDVLSAREFGATRTARIASWRTGADKIDNEDLMSMINDVSKGRFAGQLAIALKGFAPPQYITSAISNLVRSCG
jgi:putative ATP-dependent endonuclease of OLD family